jgi:hypothetical protein
MSLYNMLHGVSGNARIVLAALRLDPSSCGRFRDAWIEPGGAVLSVFTRNGGGNRDDYQDVTSALSSRADYINDFDDDFDCTYATYEFKTPAHLAELFGLIAPKDKPPSLLEKTNAAIEAIKTKTPSGVPPDRVQEIVQAIEAAVSAERSEARP